MVRRWAANPLFWMVTVALLLRIGYMIAFQTYDYTTNDVAARFAPAHLNFGFGYETGAIAHSLVNGHGFSSPFGGSTGPTAWIAPLYPALCALVFKLFGDFSLASSFVILALNSVFSALTCIPICRIGELTVGRKTGLYAGWIWAAGVLFMRWPTTWVWDMAASTLLLALAVLAALRLAETGDLKRWAGFGLLWGVAALTNPALLTVLPVTGLYAAYHLWRQRTCNIAKVSVERSRGSAIPWRPVLVSSLVFFVVISPWLIRNRVVLGEWIFIRDNFPFEFALSNYDGSNGMAWMGKHPSQNHWEYDKYKRMGELAYVAAKKHAAIDFVRHDPRQFVELTWKRMHSFWDGTYINYRPVSIEGWTTWMYWPLSLTGGLGLMLARRRQIRGLGLFAGALLLYPLPYYFTLPQPRYRHAVEPEMLLLTVYLAVVMIDAVRARLAQRSLRAAPQSLAPEPVTAD